VRKERNDDDVTIFIFKEKKKEYSVMLFVADDWRYSRKKKLFGFEKE
jgi:hypothetical protein